MPKIVYLASTMNHSQRIENKSNLVCSLATKAVAIPKK